MNTAETNIRKSHIGFRFRNDLIGVIREEAKRENRSLNNFMENLLIHYFSVDEKTPNAATIAAIEEARAGTDRYTHRYEQF